MQFHVQKWFEVKDSGAALVYYLVDSIFDYFFKKKFYQRELAIFIRTTILLLGEH